MRKKQHEEHLNHEAWAIPYADLMTLLLAFFVVMYAVSVVNEGKFRVMSESMTEAFNGGSQVIAPPPSDKQAPQAAWPSLLQPASTFDAPLAPLRAPVPLHRTAAPPAVRNSGRPSTLERIEDQVRQALQPLIDKQLVVLRRTPDRLEIEIRTDILFPSGVARLSPSAGQVLSQLAAILAPFANPLRVEGFTDDVPISTPLYPSNWELSAARAASVARLFAGHGVRPDRLGILGWGDVRPLASNATAAGRNQNRRVLVVVENDTPAPSRTRSAADQVGVALAGTAPSLPPKPADATDAPSIGSAITSAPSRAHVVEASAPGLLQATGKLRAGGVARNTVLPGQIR